jgi:hypothetical protein
MATEYQGWAEWEAKFKPKQNHLSKFECKMYETYGEEYDYIKSLDPRYVWTNVQGDMSDLLVAGVSWVNRLSYYVCEIPWEDEDDIVLLSTEEECECYSDDEDVLQQRKDEWGDPDCEKCEGNGYVTTYVG